MRVGARAGFEKAALAAGPGRAGRSGGCDGRLVGPAMSRAIAGEGGKWQSVGSGQARRQAYDPNEAIAPPVRQTNHCMEAVARRHPGAAILANGAIAGASGQRAINGGQAGARTNWRRGTKPLIVRNGRNPFSSKPLCS